MIELRSDIWKSEADYVCVTTNGIAKQARDRFPGIDRALGEGVKLLGNIPLMFNTAPGKPNIISLPTKHHWKDKSDLKLIIKSILHIAKVMRPTDTIALTRPGCALGGLSWEFTVKPAIEPLLDDRFTIYYR